jgi:hypothetical protein
MSALLQETAAYLRFGLAGVPMSTEEFDAVEECDERYRYELIGLHV